MNDKIKITGIDRRVPVSQGSCFDILNLRYKDETWQKINPKTLFYEYDNEIKNFFIHNITYNGLPLEIYIIYARTSVKYYCHTQYSPSISGTLLTSQTQDLNFESLGNVLVVNSDTYSKYFLFKDGSYSELPEIPKCIDFQFYRTFPSPNYININTEDKDEFQAEYWEAINEAHKNLYVTGLVWLTMAYRLKNGSYIRAGMPYCIYCYEWNGGTQYYWHILQYKYDNTNETLINSLKGNYKDIIDGISIFCSKPLSVFDFTRTELVNSHIQFKYEYKKIKDYYDLVDNFYEVAFISLEDLKTDGIDYTSLQFNEDLIESNNRLNYDAFDIGITRSENCLKYNNRIWRNNIFKDIKTNLINYIPIIKYPGSTDHNIVVLYKIDIGWIKGQAEQFNNSAGIVFYDTNLGLQYLNCTEVAIIDLTQNKYKKFSLIKHKHFPICWYNTDNNILWNGIKENDYPYNNFINYTALSYEELLTKLIPNQISVSELAMPYFYPAVNSYTAGNGEIKALAINSSAVDQGQWGQYQVYAFTTEGTWALNVEGFDTVVNRISFVNSDRTINKNVLMIKGGIVHCTEDGIMILEGTKSIRIDTPVNQTIDNPLDYNEDESKLLQTLGNQEFSINKIIYDTENFFDLQNLMLAFDEYNNEILFINTNKLFGEYVYQYMYCFSLNSKFWYRIYERFDKIVRDNPYQTAYGIRGSKIYYLNKETDTDNDIYFQTNPITFDCFIKLLRVILRGNIESNKIVFIIFSSLDGLKYYAISGMQNINELNINDIIIKRNLFSAKYYILVLAGNIIKTNIRNIDVMIDVKMGNKLR